jgi:hypothetical protein
MEKRRHRAWLLIGVMGAVAVTFALVFASCSPNGGNGGEGITLDEAIAIARQAVIDDDIMSLDERDTEHEEESPTGTSTSPLPHMTYSVGDPMCW